MWFAKSLRKLCEKKEKELQEKMDKLSPEEQERMLNEESVFELLKAVLGRDREETDTQSPEEHVNEETDTQSPEGQ